MPVKRTTQKQKQRQSVVIHIGDKYGKKKRAPSKRAPRKALPPSAPLIVPFNRIPPIWVQQPEPNRPFASNEPVPVPLSLAASVAAQPPARVAAPMPAAQPPATLGINKSALEEAIRKSKLEREREPLGGGFAKASPSVQAPMSFAESVKKEEPPVAMPKKAETAPLTERERMHMEQAAMVREDPRLLAHHSKRAERMKKMLEKGKAKNLAELGLE